MRFHTLRREQWTPAPLEDVFAFFSDAANLAEITPPFLGFRILTPRPIQMREGSRIQYRLSIHGIPVKWTTQIRPLLAAKSVPASVALWPSERAPRIGLAQIDARFAAIRTTLGLGPGLDFHSLRRSYVTHLIEAGWDPLFVQHQVGHEHASTTAIYTCVSSDFRTRTLRRALDATLTQATAGVAATTAAAATIGPQPAGSSR